jgi:glutaredoxin 3
MAPVRLYTTRTCAYCTAAKRWLTHVKNVPFEEIDVTFDPAARTWLRQVTGQSTVPQIFVGDTPIGGYTDMRELESRGGLDPLLRGESATGGGDGPPTRG